MEKSCFICKNMPFCKHFDNLFNKINYTQFTSNASEVINTISETIGKNCNSYAEFEKEKTCKWEISKDFIPGEMGIELIPSCTKNNFKGTAFARFKTKLDVWNCCNHCGKKIEVVE